MPRPEEEQADGAQTVMPWWTFLYLMTGVSLIVSTLLIPRPTERYILHLNPMFLITAVCMATALGQAIRRWVAETWHSPAAARTTVWLYALTLALVIGAGFHPLRAWNTGGRMVHHDQVSVGNYVQQHKRAGDKIIGLLHRKHVDTEQSSGLLLAALRRVAGQIYFPRRQDA